MAKWGQGDPRWIVEERPDATNVNNWHWTEKNASQWSKEKLKELLSDVEIEDTTGKCKIIKFSKCEGEASANNRKRKLIFFYEWNIKLEWKGQLNGCDDKVEGKIEIPNLSEENSPEEIDVNVTLTSDATDYALKVKEIMRHKGTEVIRKKLMVYIKNLKEEFASDMILPQKNDTKTTATIEKHIPKGATEKTTAGIQKLDIGGVRISTCTLTLKQTFKCTAEELYRALTIPEMVQAFTQGPCKLELQVGGKFELFGANVTGVFVRLVPNECIEQTWRFKQWPDGHYSNVMLNIEQKEDTTEINLTQKGVPVNDLERTRDGWNHYYWESMKKTFGFGAMLL